MSDSPPSLPRVCAESKLGLFTPVLPVARVGVGCQCVVCVLSVCVCAAVWLFVSGSVWDRLCVPLALCGFVWLSCASEK